MPMVFDGINKLIILTSGTVLLSVRNLWSEWVNWTCTPEIIFNQGSNTLIDIGKTRGIGTTRTANPLDITTLNINGSKFLPAMTSIGGNAIDEDVSIPVYVFLQNGWKIRPQEANHTLTVYDGVLASADGTDPFTDTLGNYRVNTRYKQPVQAISFRPTYTDPVEPAIHTLTGSVVASEATIELSKVVALTAEINASEAIVEASAVVQELLDGNIISADADFTIDLTHSLIKESEISVFINSTVSDIYADIYNPIKITGSFVSNVSSISGDLTKIYTYSVRIESENSIIEGSINTTKEITGNFEAVSSSIDLDIHLLRTITGNIISDNSTISLDTEIISRLDWAVIPELAEISLDFTGLPTITGSVESNSSILDLDFNSNPVLNISINSLSSTVTVNYSHIKAIIAEIYSSISHISGSLYKITTANINATSKPATVGFNISTSITADIKASNATLSLISYLEDIAKYYKIFSSLDVNMNYVIGSSLVDNNYLLAGFKSNRSTLNIDWDIINRINLNINMQSQNSRIKGRFGVEKETDAPEEMIIILPVNTIIEIEQIENIIEVVE